MTNPLQSTIQQLASTFAASVATAIRSASLEDIFALAGRTAAPASAARPTAAPRQAPAQAARPAARQSSPQAAPQVTGSRPRETAAPSAPRASKGRLRRRSSAEIAKALAQVVALVKSKKGGLRAEQIRAALKMEAKEMPRVLKEGLTTKALKSKGQKRSTTYTAS